MRLEKHASDAMVVSEDVHVYLTEGLLLFISVFDNIFILSFVWLVFYINFHVFYFHFFFFCDCWGQVYSSRINVCHLRLRLVGDLPSWHFFAEFACRCFMSIDFRLLTALAPLCLR
jgi:hypothetical protein